MFNPVSGKYNNSNILFVNCSQNLFIREGIRGAIGKSVRLFSGVTPDPDSTITVGSYSSAVRYKWLQCLKEHISRAHSKTE